MRSLVQTDNTEMELSRRSRTEHFSLEQGLRATAGEAGSVITKTQHAGKTIVKCPSAPGPYGRPRKH